MSHRREKRARQSARLAQMTAVSLSACIASHLSMAAAADSGAKNDDLQEIIVTGYRESLESALNRKRDGMLMSEISRFLMVSNGNVTGIVDRLVSDGLVARAQRNGDRRTSFISLTRKGRVLFADMAAAHESWVDELLGGLSARDAEQMSAKLKSFRSDWEGEA